MKTMFHVLMLVAITLLAGSAALGQPVPPPAATAPAAAPAADLPISRVVLFSSGVGYFERSGGVDGGSEVRLMFKTEDINDILKSLVVLGPKQASVTYAARDPVAKALQSFAVDITANPSLGQLLNQLRGAKVMVDATTIFGGTILGVEPRKKVLEDGKTTVTVDVLNVLSEDGLRSVELPTIQKIRLTDADLDKELTRALEVLSAARDKNKKPVTISVGGAGKQDVTLGYVVAAPVWKTTYRLVADAKDKPFLQGWAIVENTTDADWKSVKLSLVSGQPISFVMDLYTPLYASRQVVQPELYANLQAQVYSETLRREDDAARNGGFSGGVHGPVAAPSAPMAPGRGLARDQAAIGQSQSEQLDRLSEKQNGNRAKGLAGDGYAFTSWNVAGMESSALQGQAVADLFEYPIALPVNLERQKSAMFLIVNQPVEAERLSIFDPSAHPKFPLNGFDLKNSTGLYLMQGPITIYDSGAYAGDARINDLPAGSRRLISYSLDQKREVMMPEPKTTDELVTLKIDHGVLVATRKAERETRYQLVNKEEKERLVLVQHPFTPGWTLLEPKDQKPATQDLYRFRVTVPAKKDNKNGAAELKVAEERILDQRYGLTNQSPDFILSFIKTNKGSKAVLDALQGISTAQAEIADLQTKLARMQQDLTEITGDQARTRENMRVLDKTNPQYAKYVEEWSHQEDSIKKLRSDAKDLQKEIDRKHRELGEKIQALNVG